MAPIVGKNGIQTTISTKLHSNDLICGNHTSWDFPRTALVYAHFSSSIIDKKHSISLLKWHQFKINSVHITKAWSSLAH